MTAHDRSWSFATVLAAALLLFSASSASAGGPIASGETHAGTLSGPSYTEDWTFSGVAGQRVLISAVETSGSIDTYIELHQPADMTLETGSSCPPFDPCGNTIDWPLQKTGTYTIRIGDRDLNDAGTYQISLQVIGGATTSTGDPDGGALIPAGTVTGRIREISEWDAWTFHADSGQRVLLSCVETSGPIDTWMTVYPEDGSPAVASGGCPPFDPCGNSIEWQAATTGTFTLVVGDRDLDTAGGDYAISLQVIGGATTSTGDPDGGALIPAGTVTGTIREISEWDAWTFHADSGQRVLLSCVETSGPIDTWMTVYPEDGSPAVASGGCPPFDPCGNSIEWQAATSGTFTLVVGDRDLNTTGGDYAISLQVIGGATTSAGDPDGGALIPAGTVTGTIREISEWDAWTFHADSGQRVLLSCVETSGPIDTWMTVYPEDGSPAVASGGCPPFDPCGNSVEWQAATSGTFTLVVGDRDLDTAGGDYLISLQVIGGATTSAGDPDGGEIVSGQTRRGHVLVPSEWDAWTISGVAGQRLLVSVQEEQGPIDTWITLYPPDGGPAEASSGCPPFNECGDYLEAQFAQTGTYTIVVGDRDLDSAPGIYWITAMNLAGPLSSVEDVNGGWVASGDSLEALIDRPSDLDGYQFYGTAGDSVHIEAVETSGPGDTWITLYPPGGGPGEASSGCPPFNECGDMLDWHLQASGLYTIVVGDRDLTYRFGYYLKFDRVGDVKLGIQNPSPAEAQGVVPPGPIKLQWDPVAGASSYDVRFGTDPAEPMPVLAVGLDSPTVPSTLLALDTQYYWRVVAHVGADSIVGPTWRFHAVGNLVDVPQADARITEFALEPGHPNPFTDRTTISLRLPRAAEGSVRIYGLNGSLVRTLYEGRFAAGTKSFQWDGRDRDGQRVAPGVYWCRAVAGDRIGTRKLMLLR